MKGKEKSLLVANLEIVQVQDRIERRSGIHTLLTCFLFICNLNDNFLHRGKIYATQTENVYQPDKVIRRKSDSLLLWW